jgi:hypothetical protein
MREGARTSRVRAPSPKRAGAEAATALTNSPTQSPCPATTVSRGGASGVPLHCDVSKPRPRPRQRPLTARQKAGLRPPTTEAGPFADAPAPETSWEAPAALRMPRKSGNSNSCPHFLSICRKVEALPYLYTPGEASKVCAFSEPRAKFARSASGVAAPAVTQGSAARVHSIVRVQRAASRPTLSRKDRLFRSIR